MKKFYPTPEDYESLESEIIGWPSLEEKYKLMKAEQACPELQLPDYELTSAIPVCCQGCNNHPNNGGAGICHCTLPLMTYTGDFPFPIRSEVPDPRYWKPWTE